MDFHSFIEVKQVVLEYIVSYCSQVRPHSHNNGLTPNESEKQLRINTESGQIYLTIIG